MNFVNEETNVNPDNEVHQVASTYTLQWNEGTGYFEVRKNGKVVAYAPTFEDARLQALHLDSIDE